MRREVIHWTLVLVVLLVALLIVSPLWAAPAPQPVFSGPLVRLLRSPQQPGQPVRNVLRRATAVRPGIVVPRLPPAS